MDPLIAESLFFALYKVTEKIWEKVFDAAWEPVGEGLKARFARWAGKDKESLRQEAFAKAVGIAHSNTVRTAADRQQAEKILEALNSGRDTKRVEALAEEAAKLMLFSASPDVPRLTEVCNRALHWKALFGDETPPPAESIAVILSDFLTNLREALLDQEPYHDLVQREMLRAMRDIVKELRPLDHDNEPTYRYQMAAMYRELEFVGIPELKERRPISVEDIFIHLRVEREREPESEKELLESYRRAEVEGDKVALAQLYEARSRLVHASASMARINIEDALRETRELVVLGDPGAGKTTLLKYLTVICAEGWAEAELNLRANGDGSILPVFIPLREFAAECVDRNQDYSLLDYLYTHAREHLLLNLSRGFFEEALKAGRCLVCLDGLDEVWAVGQRKAITDAVKALSVLYPHNHYIVTSRIVGYEEAPLDRRDFIHYRVLPLEDDDISEFVHKWYAARERNHELRKRNADDLTAIIKREPRITDLARNPLLLTIIALVHRSEVELPHERVKLYDKCVTALMDTWDEVKGLPIAEKKRPFYRYRRRLLERLAHDLHTQPEKPGKLQTVKEGDMKSLLTRFLMQKQQLKFANDPDGAQEEARAFVRLARGRTGLLVERGEGIFGFPHLTFQEYLAACDIEKRSMPYGVDAVWKEIKDRLHDPHWREVILLLLGSLNRYEDAPTILVERVLETGKEDKFEPVLHRHLYLAARALADRVDVADDLRRRVVTTMLKIAGKAHPWEQIATISELSWLKGDNYAVDGLLALAQDQKIDYEVRIDAASALGQMGHAVEADEILFALIRDEMKTYAIAAHVFFNLFVRGHVGERVQEGLLALAQNETMDYQVRFTAILNAGELRHIGEKLRDGLLTLARDEKADNSLRRQAASALGHSGSSEEKVLDALLALVKDTKVKDWVRSAAASALGHSGSSEEKVLDALLALAKDTKVKEGVRSEAASALGKLGSSEEKVLDVLLALAKDTKVKYGVRIAAYRTLQSLVDIIK